MEKVSLKGKFSDPKSLMQAGSNIILALERFDQRHGLEECYKNYDKIAELTLKGEYNIIWGILKTIQKTNLQANKHNTPLHLLNTGLPYSLQEIIKMENSIINWLQDLNLIEDTATKIIDIEGNIRNGCLLCELAVVMHNYNVKKLGVIPEVKNGVTALSNIRKAFELFRKLGRINRRYLWSENEIFTGNRGVILGLLYDLYTSHSKRPSYINKENNSINRLKVANSKVLDLYKTEYEDIEAPTPYPLEFITTNKQITKDENNKEPILSSIIKNLSTHSLSDDSRLLECAGKEVKLLDWIKGLGLKIPKVDCFDESIMKSIKNGVLLVQIVEVLERCNMKGISMNPKSSASSLHNIQQALKVLNRKKSIPVQYLFSEIEILNGNKDFILKFLNSVRLAYPHSIRIF